MDDRDELVGKLNGEVKNMNGLITAKNITSIAKDFPLLEALVKNILPLKAPAKDILVSVLLHKSIPVLEAPAKNSPEWESLDNNILQ
jgi:hypothetical protein